MRNTRTLKYLLPVVAMFLAGCGEGSGAGNNLKNMANRIGRKSLIEEYPKVPSDDLLREVAGNRVYAELQTRYYMQLSALKAEVEKDQAKLIVVIMTPQVGKFATNANTIGVPYIQQICTNLDIDCVDLTPDISEWTSVNDPRRIPVGGNWSKDGAAFTAEMLAGVVLKYEDYHNPKTFPAADRPATFGDAQVIDPENDDSKYNPEDGEKKSDYKMTINSQGLRMLHDLKFPKTRQRLLFLGDSRIFNPFVDDKNTITELLQRRFPEKEMVNAGSLSYTMEDYLSLYREKARYTEPDVVIVCTNGGDILDEYFSHRNRYSRNPVCYKPSELEKQVYKQLSKTH